MVKKQKVSNNLVNSKEKIIECDAETLEESFGPLADVLGRAESAYAAYMDAQRQVARAYKENEQQIEIAYEKVVQQTIRDCDKIIDKALKSRKEAEQQADEAYNKAKEEIRVAYEENVRQALKVHNDKIEPEYDVYREVMDKSWQLITKQESIEIPHDSAAIESMDSIMEMSASTDPVLAELWNNKLDATYDDL